MSLAAETTISTSSAPSHKFSSNHSSSKPSNNKNNNTDDRPRVNSAAFTAYEAKKIACEARIKDIVARMDAVKNGYSMAGGENLSEKNYKLRSELIEKLKVLRSELKSFDDERRVISNQFSETLETLKKKNADVNSAKEKMSFKSISEIDNRIKEIETSLEGKRFTLSEERQLLQEITKLRKMRKVIEAMEGNNGAKNDVESLRFRLDQFKLRQGDVEEKIGSKKEEISLINTQIDALNGVRAAEQIKRTDTKTELDALRKDLDAEYTKKKLAWDEYLQAKSAKEAAYHRMIARKEEESRVKEIENEIDSLEKKLGKLGTESLIDKKWNQCTNLINYFSPLAPNVLEKEDEEEIISGNASASASVKVLRKVEGAVDLSKVQVLKKDDDCYFIAPSKNNKNKKKSSTNDSTSNSAEISKLPFHILAALTDMSLLIPKSVENDLPTLLRTVQSRRNDLQIHRDASLAEMDAKRNVILQEIEALRDKIENKDEQITASVIKKAEKAEKLALETGDADEPVDSAVVSAVDNAVVNAIDSAVDNSIDNAQE